VWLKFGLRLPPRRQQAEQLMNSVFRTGSQLSAYSWSCNWLLCLGDRVMAEFFRSGAIVVMGLTVIGAGIFVMLYS
jgi:hypothetical protein